MPWTPERRPDQHPGPGPLIRWLPGAIAVVVLVLAVVWVLFVPVADWLARHDVGSINGPLHETALDNARGRLLTLAAGVAAAGALVFTALNFNLLRRNSEKTDEWQRRTHELAEQGQVTDRYTKAIEQLGSDKLDVRGSGIYALQRVVLEAIVGAAGLDRVPLLGISQGGPVAIAYAVRHPCSTLVAGPAVTLGARRLAADRASASTPGRGAGRSR